MIFSSAKRWPVFVAMLLVVLLFAGSAQAFGWPERLKLSRYEFRTGYGYQYKDTKSRPNNFQVAFFLPSAVFPLTEAIGSGLFRGRFTWNPELFLGMFVHHPYNRPILGINPLQFRYEWEPIGRLHPYLMAGAGVLHANVNRRETGSDTNFNPSVAVGARYALNDKWAAIAEYRHIHISNAGLHENNSGLNTHTFFVGLSLEQ